LGYCDEITTDNHNNLEFLNMEDLEELLGINNAYNLDAEGGGRKG